MTMQPLTRQKPLQIISKPAVVIDPVSLLVKIDKLPVFKLIERNDGLYLQFKDGNRLRSEFRGCEIVEIKLTTLVTLLIEVEL